MENIQEKPAALLLMLHSHMPWVLGHGQWPHGEDWLSEAIAECYIPLLNSIKNLVGKGISPKFTIGISPVLCEMLTNKEYKDRFIKYCKNKVNLAKVDQINYQNRFTYLQDLNEAERNNEIKDTQQLINLSIFWQNFYNQTIVDYSDLDGDIIPKFKELQDNRHIEIVTCGATHGYFPLLGSESSIRFQIKVAIENYKKHFGKKPKGIWLPECAYRNSYVWKSLIPVSPFNSPRTRAGIETFLSEFDINYFFTDEALVKNSELLGWFADSTNNYFLSKDQEYKDKNYIFTPNPLKIYKVASGTATIKENAIVFSRDVNLALQVWSGEVGYPANSAYLDFHKKEDQSKLRYWSVTSINVDMAYKQVYYPPKTVKTLDLQAHHYIEQIKNTAKSFSNIEGQKASICIPFDTELYGHWWFEGISFLTALINGLWHTPEIEMRTCSEEISIKQPKEVIKLKEGSWGENNNHDVWSNNDTYWIWEHIYNAELKIETFFRALKKEHCLSLTNLIFNSNLENSPLKQDLILFDRFLKQLLRENLLLQASDWSFLITTISAKDYAQMRFSYHLSDFNYFYNVLERNLKPLLVVLQTHLNTTDDLPTNIKLFDFSKQDIEMLVSCEERNNLFIEIDYNWYDTDHSLDFLLNPNT